MASYYQLSTATPFIVQSLRSERASYLSGAYTAAGPPPLPIAVATGSASVILDNVVTAAAVWGVACQVPARPEIMWVLTNLDCSIKAASGIALPDRLAAFTFADATNMDLVRGPVKGAGVVGYTPGAVTGDWSAITGPLAGDLSASRLWEPLDPDLTKDGFTPMVAARNGASSLVAGDLEADFSQIRFVGYPVNYWGTAHLWASVIGQ